MPHSRVDARVEEIGGEVDDHVDARDQQHPALHQREVARQDGVHHHEADARPAEHRLHVDRAGEEIADLEPQHGDQGHERVPERVPRDHPRLRSEEHTSELQSRENLVCRLLLAKKKPHDVGADILDELAQRVSDYLWRACCVHAQYPAGPDDLDEEGYFVFNDTATAEIYTLSLHDALPI